jgi:peptidoglycan/LPS O-acetylase OafA/YrhL
MFYLLFWLWFGFTGVFLPTLCLKRKHRPFGSVLILILGSGAFVYLVIFGGPHLVGFFNAVPLIVLGGLGAVWYFRSRPPSIEPKP